MRPRGVFTMAAAAVLLVALTASPVVAADGGCAARNNPGGNPGTRDGQLMGIDDAVARTMAQITDAWFDANGITRDQMTADRVALATAADKNGDGLVCVATNHGSELNPNSKWATFWGNLLDPPAAEYYLIVDNRTGR
ncbi:MAG TPA: hypothetical protein VFL03_01710 [Candidatus Limnocylindrales bacterium]|nr:hypothetical protein [Candidatus Limnocylindrales bacterium]